MDVFQPKTERLIKLAEIYPERITELSEIFSKPTNIYLDYANIFNWSEKLKWHVDPKRLKQFLDSFPTIKTVRLYSGTLSGNENSEHFIKEVQDLNYIVTTKPVKRMRLSINVSGVPPNSPVILESFIKKTLLKKFTLETIEYLNGKLQELNNQGIIYIEHWKCNFDVEIGRDMLLDYEKNEINSFVLWSGDSDFADPISQLMKDKRSVYLFATARRVSPELSETGVLVFDIQKIRNFICRPKEIQDELRGKV